MFKHVTNFIFAKEMPNGEIVGDIYCHNLMKNCVACFNHLIETIREGKGVCCNMNCLNVGA